MMSLRDRIIWQRMTAILIFIMLCRHQEINMLLKFISNDSLSHNQLMRGVFFLLNVLCVFLLFKKVRYSLLLSMVAIIFSTLTYHVSYIPFIFDAFFHKSSLYRNHFNYIANGILVVGIGYLYFIYTDQPKKVIM